MAKSISVFKAKASSARAAVANRSGGGDSGATSGGSGGGGGGGAGGEAAPPYFTPSPPALLSSLPPAAAAAADTTAPASHSLPALPLMPSMSEEQQIELAIQESMKICAREDVILINQETLNQRLHDLHLVAVEMLSDGNCQFRSLSKELFGSADHHAIVRDVVTAHMARQHADYAPFIDGEDWTSYIQHMSKDQTWGDELTLRAAADVYNVKINVITSDTENWHLLYAPACVEEGRECRECFLCYVS